MKKIFYFLILNINFIFSMIEVKKSVIDKNILYKTGLYISSLKEKKNFPDKYSTLDFMFMGSLIKSFPDEALKASFKNKFLKFMGEENYIPFKNEFLLEDKIKNFIPEINDLLDIAEKFSTEPEINSELYFFIKKLIKAEEKINKANIEKITSLDELFDALERDPSEEIKELSTKIDYIMAGYVSGIFESL